MYPFPIKDEKASTIAKILVNQLFLEYGVFPRTLLSDNDPCFRAKILDEITEYSGIKYWYTSANMASANRKIQQKHRELAYMLGVDAKQEPENWDDHLLL